MAHIIRPIGTFSADGGWTAVGAPTLWEAVDEVVPADGDYARVLANNQSWVSQFGPGTDHGIHTGHIIRWRMQRGAVAIRLVLEIWQDNAWLFTLGTVGFLGPPNIFYDHSITFTAPQAALITNYTTLGLNLRSNNFNPTNWGLISWVELELPGDYLTTPVAQTVPATEVT